MSKEVTMSLLNDWRKTIGLTALDYPVPTHANTFWYSLGGITLICFIITFLTGALLTQLYNPTPTIAHASVSYISNTPGIWLMRALHYWSANVGFLLLIAHMLRVMITGAFRPPRIITYLFGLALLFIAFQLFFTGTVLKWDQEGYEALAHFVALNKLLGPIGAVFQEDFTLSTSMLARMYGLHVGVFPILFLVLIIVHAFYVKHLGIAPKPYQIDEDYEKSLAAGDTFTIHVKRLLVYGLVLIVVLTALAFLFPPGILKAPVPGVEITKPPWLFWIFYPIESAIGIIGILLGSGVIAIGLILVPILGLAISEEKKLFSVVRTIVIAGLIIWIVLLVITFFSPVMKHI
jgi:ubiquinol-cytochrome c reductase cytochrome b subunit